MKGQQTSKTSFLAFFHPSLRTSNLLRPQIQKHLQILDEASLCWKGMNKGTTGKFVISLRTETKWTPQFEVLGCLLLAGEAVFWLPLQFLKFRVPHHAHVKSHCVVVKHQGSTPGSSNDEPIPATQNICGTHK
jgi:hypothetical protein